MTPSAITAALVSVEPFGDRTHAASGSAFLVLASFIVSFLAIRTSARMTRSVSWWPGGVQTGGVHLHHLVWGICMVLLAGFVEFTAAPGSTLSHACAIVFGIGAGFTLDEFALWVHLEDVYWSQEGRRSVDAVVIAVAFAGLVVTGTTPFGLDDPGSISATVVVVVLVLGLAAVAFVKGRILLGVLGLFVPVFALAGALRLAHPSSPWARRRYSGARLERSRERFASSRRAERWRVRAMDALTGAPSKSDGD